MTKLFMKLLTKTDLVKSNLNLIKSSVNLLIKLNVHPHIRSSVNLLIK